MSEITENRPVIDEEQLHHDMGLGAIWTGSRLIIGSTTMLFAGIAFAFFYLKSLDTHGLFDPHGQTASTLVGSVILGLVVVSAFISNYSTWRLKKGYSFDWQVGSVISLLLGLLAVGLQIWELTRLNFLPGASGYAGVYIAFVPIYSGVMFLSMYWLETLVARSIRARKALAQDGGAGLSKLPMAENFRASVDAFNYFWNFMVLISVIFFIIFYVL